MSAGILSTLCILTLYILIFTGWFSAFTQDLGASRRMIGSFLIMAAVLAQTPAIPVQSTFSIQPGSLTLLGLLYAFGRKTNRQFWVSSSSLAIFLGSALFFWHELTHVDTDWTDPIFRLVALLLFIPIVMGCTKRIEEQIVLVISGFIISHLWILFFHHDMLTPLVLGNDEYLDTVWICLVSLFVLHYALRSLTVWRKRREKMGLDLIDRE